MADTHRVKILVQKRTSLKSQITSLTNLLDKGRINGSTLRLRITRLTKLYHAYEEFNDELAVLDPNDVHQNEFSSIQERFYSLAGDVETRLSAGDVSDRDNGMSSNEIRIENTGTVTTFKKRRIKLPEARRLMASSKIG